MPQPHNLSWEIDAGHDADGRAGWLSLDFVPAMWRDTEADAIDADVAARDFHEYVDNHPELVFHVPLPRFHICSAHPAAREVVRRGHLPASFACPLRHDRCPMRELLARMRGCDVKLTAGLRGAGDAQRALGADAAGSLPSARIGP